MYADDTKIYPVFDTPISPMDMSGDIVCRTGKSCQITCPTVR